MFRIGEFSRLTQVSVRMLRYYDETGLLKPAQSDTFTGYRLYSAEQIPSLNKILFLRDLGYTVAEIAAVLDNWDTAYIGQKLEDRQNQIKAGIEKEKEKLQKIKQAKRDLQKEQINIHYNVAIKAVPAYQVLSLRRVMPDYYAEGLLWKELSAFAHENRVVVSQNTFTIYHDPDHRDKDVDMEVCVPVAKPGKSQGDFVFYNTEPAAHMACTLVYGPFENIAGSYASFANWLQAHSQYRMAGKSRQTVHRGPWNEEKPENYLTEIQIPLIKL